MLAPLSCLIPQRPCSDIRVQEFVKVSHKVGEATRDDEEVLRVVSIKSLAHDVSPSAQGLMHSFPSGPFGGFAT